MPQSFDIYHLPFRNINCPRGMTLASCSRGHLMGSRESKLLKIESSPKFSEFGNPGEWNQLPRPGNHAGTCAVSPGWKFLLVVGLFGVRMPCGHDDCSTSE